MYAYAKGCTRTHAHRPLDYIDVTANLEIVQPLVNVVLVFGQNMIPNHEFALSGMLGTRGGLLKYDLGRDVPLRLEK